MINEGMHKVTHTWSSSDGKSWKYRGEHDSADDAADVAMTRVGKESGYHAIGTKKKALYYVDHKGRIYGINEAAIEPPHERKFMGKKKTPVDVKPELKSSAEQASTQRKSTNEEADLDEGLQMLPEPVKMRYIGPSDGAVTHGQHVYALSSHKGTAASGGAVKIDTGKMRCVVHKTHLEPVKEETRRIDEVSKEELRAMALAAAQKVQVTKVPAGASSDISSYKWKKAMQNGGKVAATKAVMHDPEEFSPSATFKGTNAHRKHVREDAESLDELSRKTLTSYTDKASDDIIKLSKEAKTKLRLKNFSNDQRGRAERSALGKKYDKKIIKRFDNYSLAHEKLNGSARVNASEEVEPIDELSRDTLVSYIGKSAKDATAHQAVEKPWTNRSIAKKRLDGIRLAADKVASPKNRGYFTRISASEETVSETNRPSHHNPTVLVTYKDNKGAGGVKRIPKSEYDPKLHNLVEWVSKEQLAANRKARVDKFIENGAKVKKIMDDEHKKNGVKKYDPKNTKEDVEQVNELSFKKLGDYRRASLKDSIKRLSTRAGNVEHKEKLEKRKAGADLAWSKMGLSRNKPKVQSTEGEASTRRSAEIHQAAMKNVKPSTQAMKDGVDKMGELARKSAHLFKNQKEEHHQFITDLQLAIESNGAHPVTFADGSRAAISPGYADRIIAKYETISEESKRNEFVSTISSNLKTLRESIKR